MQQQEQELRAEAARANAPAVRPVGRLCMDPATRPAPAPERPVGRPRASTHVQAPPVEPERLLVHVQLSAHTDSVTLQQMRTVRRRPCPLMRHQQRRSPLLMRHQQRGMSRVALMVAARGDPDEVSNDSKDVCRPGWIC
eukprot:1148921-Pelagomonas_calceolata.AAC.3